MRIKPYIIALLILLPLSISGQTKPAIDSLVFKAKELINSDLEKSLEYSYRAFELSDKEDYYWGKLYAANWLSEAYYYLGTLDSIDYYNQLTLKLSTAQNDKKEIANSLVAIGMSVKERGKPRKALNHFFKARANMTARQDTSEIADLLLRIGGVYIDLDMLDSAMVYCKDAYDLNELLGDKRYMAYALNDMSVVQKKIGNIDKALQLSEEAIGLFEGLEDFYNIISSRNNRGILMKEIKDYDAALVEYEEASRLAKEIGFKQGVMALADNKGILFNLLNQPRKAITEFDTAIKHATELEITSTISDAKVNMARSYLMLGQMANAKQEVSEGLALAQKAKSPEKTLEAHQISREIYAADGNYKQALYHFEQAKVIEDSIYNLAKTQQINELQTKFETTKKDAEIALLNTNAELDKARNRGLLTGLILLAISAAAWIYNLISRRKRERKILLAEKALEHQKRLSAERELEFKHKELTSKVLQLARKNEFLVSLEEEVQGLKSNVDTEVSKTTRKITRLIKQDISEDSQWEQFGTEFRSLHQGYLEALTAKHGDFTSGEIRLISLLKMNLSSKDIADTLRISADGISKARYRLRKTLGITTEVDLQNYLMNFKA